MNVCPSANPNNNEFESDIRIGSTGPRNVTLSWTSYLSNSSYVVQHRLQQENQVYTSSSEVSL